MAAHMVAILQKSLKGQCSRALMRLTQLSIFCVAICAGSLVHARCGLMPAEALQVDLVQLTGKSADDLSLMPPCRYEYRDGRVMIRFGQLPPMCNGPECKNRAPEEKPAHQMALIRTGGGTSFSAILSTSTDFERRQDTLAKALPGDWFFNSVALPPLQRPPE